jgi:hypothetical protein
MQAYIPTMLTGQGRAFRDGIFSGENPLVNYQASTQEFADGSLGYVFQDGSLGAGAPRGQHTVNPLQAKMRLLRKYLGFRGLGAAAPRSQYSVNPLQAKMRMLRQRLSLRGLGAAAPQWNVGSNRNLEYLQALKRRTSGFGQEENLMAPAPPEPAPDVSASSVGAMKVVGLLAVAGLGAYGLYRIAKKK